MIIDNNVTLYKIIDKVTKEDVMKLAKKIHLDTIVLVKGSDTSE